MLEGHALHLRYDNPEACGSFVIDPGTTNESGGPTFYLPCFTEPDLQNDGVGWCDFFNRSNAAGDGPKYTQFLFYDPMNGSDLLVKVIYFDDGRVRVSINNETSQIPDVDNVGIQHNQQLFGFNPTDREKESQPS